MNSDIASFPPPPPGPYRPYAYEDGGPPARKPARVPLGAAALVALAIVPVGLSAGSGSDVAGAIVAYIVLVYGLGLVAALLVVAGLAKLADSRAVGIVGTLMVSGFALLGLLATSGG